ncbi:putative reverse transcriptase domain-containing protein, partial [Tanacetum coccineum]
HISGAIGKRGGARGRRGGDRGGRRGCVRGSTSRLKLMDEDDIRQSMEDEYMQGLLDKQDDLRQKQEKEHQDKLDEEALQQAMEEELIFPDQEDSIDVEMYNRTKASINFMVNTQEFVTHGQPSFVEANLEDMLRACVLDFEGSWGIHLPLVKFSYNNSYHYSVRCGPFKALYGRKCRSPIMWAEIKEELVEILEREVKKLKRNRIDIVKVWWNSKYGPEFTREHKDQMKLKYPHLFIDVSS